MPAPSLHWFRDDLRLADNPALTAAASAGPTLCLYILDEGGPRRPFGGAGLWWLSKSLKALEQALARKGGQLIVLRGDPARILPRLVEQCGIDLVTWNRRYDGESVVLDRQLMADLTAAGTTVESFNAALLNEPWQVTTKTGDPMKVFTAYWRTARQRGEPAAPLPPPERIEPLKLPAEVEALSIADLALEPDQPDWAGGLRETWSPGETAASERLGEFLSGALGGYAEQRDRPDREATSRLSPHLRFGEIGPRQIWHATRSAVESGEAAGSAADAEKFLSEIGWREFSYHLLFHNPDLAKANYNRRFDAFPWRKDAVALTAWQRGLTGYPIIDAGMRQLWTTGWMHNRVRMIAASFLIKHLLIDWRRGEDWFWDTLVDADPANNPASWQWVAGSGADASPYYRVFNPVTQGLKFDPKGIYVRRWVPEIGELEVALIHQPWKADAAALRGAGIEFGKTYPRPIVDLDLGRRRALDALQAMRSA